MTLAENRNDHDPKAAREDEGEGVARGTSASTPSSPSTPLAELATTLKVLKDAQRSAGSPSYDARIAHLDALERVLLTRKQDVVDAIAADFGVRSRQETLAGEVMVVLNEIKHARAHLHEWMEVEPRDVGWMFMPARAEIVMQPVGVIGIVAPWNYPLQLALGPLVGALAAGNRAMLKPSDLTPKTASVLAALIADAFAPDHVTVVTGGLDVAEAFSKLPFDHLVFTGSTRLGKIVMKAAAENLVPVTLELGGKSPAIVGEGFALGQAATRILYGKCFNAGQTCIAPDYVLVPRKKLDAFVQECRSAFAKMYPTVVGNQDYTSIVNDKHYDRLTSYLEEARSRGFTIVELAGEGADRASRKMPPVLVLGASEDSLLLQEEIFGPILPVIPYDALDEAIAYVNDHPRPLALYFFEHDGRAVDRVLAETISGGVGINETLLHVAQSDLPFGGTGPSGMGHYHAREGFETFTKKKSVFYQSRVNGMALFRPPYGSRIDTALRFLVGK